MERTAKTHTGQAQAGPTAAGVCAAAPAVTHSSPHLQQQRRLFEGIHNSPRMLAQRAQIQRTFGGVIQRYRAVAGGDYAAHTDAQEPQAMFTHQDPAAALRDVGDALTQYPGYAFTAKAHLVRADMLQMLGTQYPGYAFTAKAPDAKPNLLAADDNSVALQTEAEPKEFYARSRHAPPRWTRRPPTSTPAPNWYGCAWWPWCSARATSRRRRMSMTIPAT